MAFSRLRASVARIDGRFAGGFLRAEGVAFLVIETVQGINIGLGAGDNDVRVGTSARGAVFTLAQAHGQRRQHGGLRENFIVRKMSNGVGVERIFPVHCPSIDKIEVTRKGKVRRAKLYYLRKLSGKAARIKERRDFN